METSAEWPNFNVATVWPATVDQYGQPSYGTPYTINCTWEHKGEAQTDDNGVEFVAASTFWFKGAYGQNGPKRGDYIAKFSQTAQADPFQAGASIIKKVASWDRSPLGEPNNPDWAVFT